jgi:phenylpyruvate tautomerase PptA (4-oxalocrotonate tautomerase family)
MPLVRISLPAGKDAGYVKGVSDAVQDAMVATIDVPAADRFHVFSDHAPDRLVIDPTYLGIERGRGALIVEITMRGGRTVEKKKALYRAIAGNIHDRLGVRREDVMIVLAENELIDWSFGNGESQYVKD